MADEVRAKIAGAGITQVRVFVLGRRVTLTGFVPSPEAKERVIALAKGARGVQAVIDDLQVRKTRE
ncbi:MAG: BON domain-containing protein [Syntrophorhabdales bacterium]|jgi:osmotically-inducible protein OsmY